MGLHLRRAGLLCLGRNSCGGDHFSAEREAGLEHAGRACPHEKRASIWKLKAIPAVVEHIGAQHGRIPLAVVSGSKRDSVTSSLTSVKLLDKFDTLVCAGDYEKGKPDPEAFLLAASKLGVAPRACLVFEDTDLGIQAASAAGMASVKIPPPWER
jgi:beta-phosphoglucomutase-like phosphatase (HAD superfamily)